MFFQKLFKKDHLFFAKQGEKYLGQERFADARHAFSEALHCLPPHLPDFNSIQQNFLERVSFCGTALAKVNLQEAEFAFQQGNHAKAAEHAHLIKDLTQDAEILKAASELLEGCSAQPEPSHHVSHGSHACGAGCSGSHGSHQTLPIEDNFHQTLSAADRFELLTNTLPGDLPARYGKMGNEFVQAYLDAADGNYEAALETYQKLMQREKSDILLHEIAAITHRSGNHDLSERLLRQALELNSGNALVSMALVDLFLETGRASEALERLESMLADDLMVEQALLLKGDILQHCRQLEESLDIYASALSLPGAARPAAERMVPLLEQAGRTADAQFLFKKYLKGCC